MENKNVFYQDVIKTASKILLKTQPKKSVKTTKASSKKTTIKAPSKKTTLSVKAPSKTTLSVKAPSKIQLPTVIQPIYKNTNPTIVKQSINQYLVNHSTYQLTQLKPFPTIETTPNDIVDNITFQYTIQSFI